MFVLKFSLFIWNLYTEYYRNIISYALNHSWSRIQCWPLIVLFQSSHAKKWCHDNGMRRQLAWTLTIMLFTITISANFVIYDTRSYYAIVVSHLQCYSKYDAWWKRCSNYWGLCRNTSHWEDGWQEFIHSLLSFTRWWIELIWMLIVRGNYVLI